MDCEELHCSVFLPGRCLVKFETADDDSSPVLVQPKCDLIGRVPESAKSRLRPFLAWETFDHCYNGDDLMLSLGNIKCPSWNMPMGEDPYIGTILTAVLGRAWRTGKPVERMI